MTFSSEPLTDFTDPAHVDAYQAALENVESRLGADYPLTIGGEQVATNGWLESHNPADPSQLIGRSAAAGPGEVDQALAAGWEAFRPWAALEMSERAALVRNLAGVMRRRRFELAAWMTFPKGVRMADDLELARDLRE